MERFRIGDKIHIIHKGEKAEPTYTIVDILEDYGGNSYWLKSSSGKMALESETPETVFEKVTNAEA